MNGKRGREGRKRGAIRRGKPKARKPPKGSEAIDDEKGIRALPIGRESGSGDAREGREVTGRAKARARARTNARASGRTLARRSRRRPSSIESKKRLGHRHHHHRNRNRNEPPPIGDAASGADDDVLPLSPEARAVAARFDYVPKRGPPPRAPDALLKRLAEPFRLCYIVGDSGSGKTTCLAQLAGVLRLDALEERPRRDPRAAAIDYWPSKDEAVARMGAVGLNSVPSWFRTFDELSRGEQFRIALACGLRSGVVVDEFTSGLDRATARSLASNLSKFAERRGLERIVMAGCQHDVGSLAPPRSRPRRPLRCQREDDDSHRGASRRGSPHRNRGRHWVRRRHQTRFLDRSRRDEREKRRARGRERERGRKRIGSGDGRGDVSRRSGGGTTGTPAMGQAVGKRRREASPPSSVPVSHADIDSMRMELRRSDSGRWGAYSPHHYLSGEHPLQRAVLGGFVSVEGVARNAAFAPAPLPGMKDPSRREHRLVVLPAFQGLGIGAALSEAVAEIYLAKGYRYYTKTRHPRLGVYRDASPLYASTPSTASGRRSQRHVEDGLRAVILPRIRGEGTACACRKDTPPPPLRERVDDDDADDNDDEDERGDGCGGGVDRDDDGRRPGPSGERNPRSRRRHPAAIREEGARSGRPKRSGWEGRGGRARKRRQGGRRRRMAPAEDVRLGQDHQQGGRRGEDRREEDAVRQGGPPRARRRGAGGVAVRERDLPRALQDQPLPVDGDGGGDPRRRRRR